MERYAGCWRCIVRGFLMVVLGTVLVPPSLGYDLVTKDFEDESDASLAKQFLDLASPGCSSTHCAKSRLPEKGPPKVQVQCQVGVTPGLMVSFDFRVEAEEGAARKVVATLRAARGKAVRKFGRVSGEWKHVEFEVLECEPVPKLKNTEPLLPGDVINAFHLQIQGPGKRDERVIYIDNLRFYVPDK